MARASDDRMEALSSYVPQAVLSHLASVSGSPDQPHADPAQAALLLIDITGFTPITAAAIERGVSGTEELSRSFNSYLGLIIDLITDHGGDISKIVGDALIPAWPASNEDLAAATRRAATCALAIARQLGDYEEGDLRLSVKVGVSAGDCVAMHVGGLEGRWLFLIAGPVVAQLSELEQHLIPGDVFASPEAWALISDRFMGQPSRGGYVRVRSAGQPAALRPLAPVAVPAEREPRVRGYIPEVLLSRIDAGQAEWLAELRRTTVVFANVRGLTDATVNVLPLIDSLAKASQRVARHYNGWPKEVTMDDKGTTLTLVFGVPPFTHEDDAARAVGAALDLQDEVERLELRAGIGVASGPTFCGPAGNSRRHDFAMLGSHVNLAARLMQVADDGVVLCDGATHDEASGHAFERLPAYVLKGLSTPTDVYRAARTATASDRPSGLVDRRSELAAASEALDRLEAGSPTLVVIEGEPGIGKTSVVHEWARSAQRRHVNVLVSEVSEIQTSTPYHPWRSVFERLLEVASVRDRATRQAVVARRLAEARLNIDLAPLLNSLLALDLPDNELTSQLTGSVRADNTLDVLVGLLRQSASSGPLMIVLEDAQWLDAASWQLVERAHREVPRLLLVATTRPVAGGGDERPVAPDDGASTIRLGPLSHADALALAARRSGASELADSVATIVRERAEGNPLFIEQLTYAMRDAGRIVVDRGVLRAVGDSPNLAGAIIPDSVQRVITSRLDQLPPAQAMTLKVASVVGSRFAVRTLADIHPLSSGGDVLRDDLDNLTRLGLLVRASAAPEPSYEFGHKITQEVAYNLMPSAQSRQLHRRVAEWYENAYAADLSPLHAFLSHHWRNAGEPARAVDYLELAGMEALRSFANQEAIGFLREALELNDAAALATDAARRARWHLSLGDAYVNLSRYREGREQLERGLRLLGRYPPTARWRRVLALVGQLVRQGLHRVGVRRRRRLSDEQRDELVAVARAYERLAEAAYYEGDTLLALYSSIRILNEAEASGSAAETARGLAGTGALFGLAPLPRIARFYLDRALAGLDSVDDAATHEIVRIVVGFYYVGAGMWEPAREQLAIVRSTARRLGDRRRLQDAVGNQLEIDYLQGSFRSAMDLSSEMVMIARARNDRRFEADALVARAHATWELGQTEEALSALGGVRQMGIEEPDLPEELRIKTQGLLALIHSARGDRAAAVAAAEEATRLTSGQRPYYFATFFGYVGPVHVYLDQWEADDASGETRRRAEQALALLRQYARVFPIGRPRRALLEGRLAWLAGRRGAAFGHWRRAVQLAGQLSMPYEQALAHYEMGRHLEATDPQRAINLATARELLSSLGAARAMALVDAAAGGRQLPA